ncbi:MAG TPA: DMT family transporter [Xanthobacteraceae bacterium]|jgi:drug/metabolite transporter (DMT)-like permease|nr:DMT family transporter [Xanthobacteraceae bacterium]
MSEIAEHPVTVAAPSRPRIGHVDLVLYGVTVLSWGLSWGAIHFQLGTVDPDVSVFWRFLIATPIMMGCAVFRGENLRFGLSDHLRFMLLGALIFSTNFLVFYYASQYFASGLVSVVFSLAAIVNVFFGKLFLGAAVDRRVVVGAILGALGVGALFYPEIATTHLDGAAFKGLALCVSGVLLFCLGNVVSVKLQRRGSPVFAASGWGMLYGSILLGLFAAALGHPFVIEPTVTYIGGLIYLAVFASVVGFACYFRLLARIGADRAAYATVLMPVIALVVSTVAESYHWSWQGAVGILAVLAGNAFVLRSARR